MRVVFVILVAFNLSLYAQCYKIGVLAEFVRPTARTALPFGLDIQRGVDLALLKLAGKKSIPCIEIEKLDIGNTIANIPDLIRNAKRDKKISLFLGLGISDQVLIAAPAINETKSLLLTPTASSDEITKVSDRIIMIFPKNSFIVQSLAKEIYKKKIRKVAMVYAENSTYSKDMSKEFKKIFKEIGGSVSIEIPVRMGRIHLEPHEAALRKADYTHVFLPLYELDAAKVIAFLSKRKIKSDFIGTDAWGTYSKVIRSVTQHLSFSAMVPTIYSPKMPTQLNKEFVADFERLHHETPTDLASFSYEGLIFYHQMLLGCGAEGVLANPGQCIRKILPYSSLTGVIESMSGLSLERPIQVSYFDGSQKE